VISGKLLHPPPSPSTRIPKGLRNSTPGIPSSSQGGTYFNPAFRITRSPDHGSPDFLPRPPIFSFLLQTKHLLKIDPWMALGWPLGGPRATQTQSQTQSGRGSQSESTHASPCALAFSGQKLRANSQKPNCQISFPAHTLRRCSSIPSFVRPCNCKLERSLKRYTVSVVGPTLDLHSEVPLHL
jgi:hypothetical protein